MQSVAPSTSDEREIHALLETYERALNTSDPELAASCFTSDGVLMQPMLPTARGTELVGAYADGFAKRTLDVTFTLDELAVAGSTIAYALTHTVGTTTLLADGAGSIGYRREMFILTREGEAWKIARYLFNHDAEPA